jgi:cell division protein FtsL
MSDVDFEYAIRKDVRNNPVVREVDRARLREMWRWVALGALLVLVVLFSALQHFELLRYGYRIEKMREERAAEERLQRHLRLEIQSLRAPRRIERIAMRQLRLVPVSQERAIVVERVPSAPPPSRALVASR